MTKTSNTWAQPTEVSDIDIAFAARGPQLTPAYEDVPDDFKHGHSPEEAFISHWFANGDPFSAFDVYGPVDGVDGRKAVRHLQVVLGTFGTKHEHKISGAAYLMSLWFERVEPKSTK